MGPRGVASVRQGEGPGGGAPVYPERTTRHRADDGTRTRDPHLGKVPKDVQLVPSSPLTCGSVRGVLRPMALFPPRSRALYNYPDCLWPRRRRQPAPSRRNRWRLSARRTSHGPRAGRPLILVEPPTSASQCRPRTVTDGGRREHSARRSDPNVIPRNRRSDRPGSRHQRYSACAFGTPLIGTSGRMPGRRDRRDIEAVQPFPQPGIGEG